ncbi:AN1-type zinc finger protein 2A isoform X1 [Bos javanicus]|uniref:AN1-type zinc finger protein 2A isoform X1 n=1 Tax=Bos javanicus TaxID=9906 RepID=UPI002AA9262C|nr:AN1-type zinc finger protein 2A isoform X1 [Bos javanicus]
MSEEPRAGRGPQQTVRGSLSRPQRGGSPASCTSPSCVLPGPTQVVLWDAGRVAPSLGLQHDSTPHSCEAESPSAAAGSGLRSSADWSRGFWFLVRVHLHVLQPLPASCAQCRTKSIDSLEQEKVFTFRCSREGCRRREMLRVACEECRGSFCLQHRHPLDHGCTRRGPPGSLAGSLEPRPSGASREGLGSWLARHFRFKVK